MDLAPRTFDALALLVREEGRLVPKARFFDEVWGEVAVGDEALTQCIKTLRRQLGDEVASPRYILTVPKHGYRFVAAVSAVAPPGPPSEQREVAPNGSLADLAPPTSAVPVPQPAASAVTFAPVEVGAASRGPRPGIASTAAGTGLGGATAGLLGGVLYSILLIAPADAEVGRTSLTALLFALNAMVGALGGLGLGLGYGIASAVSSNPIARILAAAAGGFLVGAISHLLGIDAFNLVLGEGPVGITGGAEGAALSGLVVVGFLVARRDRHRVLGTAVGGGIAGLLIVAFGGRLMAGSLERLAETFADSSALAPLAPFFAEARFGEWSELLLGGLEGVIFGGGIGAALVLARRRVRRSE